MISIEKSWHTEREWFVRRGASYCGEVMYYPISMRWHARPWCISGRQTGQFFDTLDGAIRFIVD
jgi:hypothetical protein